MNKVNYNDLLAEWVDSFATWKETDYARRDDGTFDWIDWCTHGGEDFDKFMTAKLSQLGEESETDWHPGMRVTKDFFDGKTEAKQLEECSELGENSED